MLKILDTTLRDGNYAVDFKFTAKDMTLIASALDQCGMPMIEIGHGLGLNAGGQRDMLSASTDMEMLVAAAEAIKSNQWGMFFIPEIGRMEDMELAARHGMKFIRIGTNVTKTVEAQKYVARAKELGLLVSCNFMKTYALSPDQVGAKAAEAQKFGADIVSVVDSAGGFLPEDIEAYFSAGL